MFQLFRNINRTREIAGILWKYGFEDVVSQTSLRRFIPKRKRLGWRRGHPMSSYSRWELMRMAAEELGPTFVKLAQVLSNRPDVLPPLLIKELQKLQSEVPPIDFEEMKPIIEENLGKPIKAVFEQLREKPIGSASIGQVYVGRLLDGKKIVIKVRRPNIVHKVETDLLILKELAQRGDNFFKSQGVYNAADIIKAFEKSILKELDYRTEARFMMQFKNYYKKIKTFYVPKVYNAYSTEEVLIMEYVKGCKITDVEQIRKWRLNPEKVAERGMDIYMTQIFEHGYFHADPHPGNIIIEPTGRICLIDFGMVGRLSKSDKFAFSGIILGMAQQDARKMGNALLQLSIDAEVHDRHAFESDLQDLIDDFGMLDLSEIRFADLASRLQQILKDYRIKVTGSIFILLRAFTILEGIGKSIHPTFKTYEFVKPYGLKLLRQYYSPKNIAKNLYKTAEDSLSLIYSLPIEVKDVLQKINRGKIQIETIDPTAARNTQRINRALSRLALAIIIVGLLIMSSLLVLAFEGFTFMSVISYTVATTLGILWFFATLIERR